MSYLFYQSFFLCFVDEYSVQMSHVSNIICGANALSSPSALSNIKCPSLDAVELTKSFTGSNESCFKITELKPYASCYNSQPFDLVKMQKMFTDFRDYYYRTGRYILNNISGRLINSSMY